MEAVRGLGALLHRRGEPLEEPGQQGVCRGQEHGGGPAPREGALE